MKLVEQTAWWHVYPLNALGAPIFDVESKELVHRLPALIPWLDYAKELGCTGVLLTPIFESTSHGYDTLDHFKIDRRLGTNEDFDQFMAAANERNLGIILDGVFNHVCVNHPLVKQTFENKNFGEDCPIKLSWVDGVAHPHYWEGHETLVELNHSSPTAKALVKDAMLFWLRKGIAGWRLDVAYAIPKDFLAEVITEVKTEFPDAIFSGEVIHGDLPSFIDEAKLDTVTQYWLWKAIWSSINDRNMWELAHSLGQHQEMSTGRIMQTFIGNHDVTRIATKIGKAGAELAAIILMTVPGVPSVYYGDEQAFHGEKQETGKYADVAVRPQLPESPEKLFEFGWPLFRFYQKLISIRADNPWLTTADIEVTGRDSDWISYNCTSGDNTLTAHLTLEEHPTAKVEVNGELILDWVSEHCLKVEP